MKGKMSLKVEVTDEVGAFPITESWEFKVDNTYEVVDSWLDLFEKILVTQGFSNYTLEIVDTSFEPQDVEEDFKKHLSKESKNENI